MAAEPASGPDAKGGNGEAMFGRSGNINNRILSLIVFRMVLLALVLLYLLLTLLPLPALNQLPLGDFLIIIGGYSLVNFLYYLYLRFQVEVLKTGRNFIFLQFCIDILLISILVIRTGGIDSQVNLAYLIVIMLSALFLEQGTIYAVTIISLAFYFLSLSAFQFLFLPDFLFKTDNLFDSPEWHRITIATSVQFVFCFFTALLSVFMQAAYRTSRQALHEKERHIRELRLMRQRIVDTLPSGLATCSNSGKLNFINQMGRKLLRLKEKDQEDFNIWQCFEIEPSPTPDAAITGYRARVERRVTLGGTKRTMGISYSPLAAEAGGPGYIVVFQDLTKVKLLEQQKRLAERMSAIGKVAAGVAHEIRNPLAAMSGSIQVLREMVPPDDQAAQDLAEIVTRESNRLNEIISQLLAYARPGPPADFTPINFAELIPRFVVLARVDTEPKALTLTYECRDRDALILGDEGKLTQVFWNLAKNSFNACEHGGTVKIASFTWGQDVVCSIEDDGIGMSDEQLNDLFTPFRSFSKGGTGLGMSIVYDIIHMHHGEINVDSSPGNGTRINITFPRYQE